MNDDTKYVNMHTARLMMGSPKTCKGKVSYDKKGAVSAKNLRYKHDHKELRVYHCPDCNMWHLTSRI